MGKLTINNHFQYISRAPFQCSTSLLSGTMVAAEESDFGWAVVSRHDASEQDGRSALWGRGLGGWAVGRCPGLGGGK